MTMPEGAFHRAPRPLIGWLTVVLVSALVLFILAVLTAIAVGFWKTAATGHGVPDMTGGLGNLGALVAAILGSCGLGGLVFGQRHMERMDQQARGLPPYGPFPQPEQPLGPSPDGPRPGDTP